MVALICPLIIAMIRLGDDVADGLGAGAARMEGEGLAGEILPRLVGLVGDREEHEARRLEDDAQRRLALLHDGVGRADADVRLAVDDRLDREILLGEMRDLVVDAFLLGPLEGDDHRKRFG
jgi:hypothetical protein